MTVRRKPVRFLPLYKYSLKLKVNTDPTGLSSVTIASNSSNAEFERLPRSSKGKVIFAPDESDRQLSPLLSVTAAELAVPVEMKPDGRVPAALDSKV